MQEYKSVYRTLTAGVTLTNPDGSMAAQNVQEFAQYLSHNYLEQGFKVHTITLLRVVPADPALGTGYMTEWAYHLVKEWEAEKETVSKKSKSTE